MALCGQRYRQGARGGLRRRRLSPRPRIGQPAPEWLLNAAVWCRRRLHPTLFEPVGPPIEQTAARLRRLRDLLDSYDDPLPIPGKATKVVATSSAYDRVLCDACRALEIDQELWETSGIEREAERLRIEAALQGAGLVLRPRRRTGR